MGEEAFEKPGSHFNSEPDIERREVISSINGVYMVCCREIGGLSPELNEYFEGVQASQFGNVVGKIGRLGQSISVRVGSGLNW